LLEVVQHVLRAVGRPDGETMMIVVLEGSASTHRDEPRIPDLGENHCPSRLTQIDERLTEGDPGITYVASTTPSASSATSKASIEIETSTEL
jgi:hypothetical protein